MSTPLRMRSVARDRNLAARLDAVVPIAMERADLDAWVITAREYNEDPVLQTMLPETWLGTSRRRTIVVFFRTEDGTVGRTAISRYPIGTLFTSSWNPSEQPDQWRRLREVLEEQDPRRIGVNISELFPLADGLSESEHRAMVDALGPDLAARLVGAEAAAITWLETRTAAEIDTLREACTIAHGLLRRALSQEVIRSGATSTADIEWWLRQTVHDAGLRVWFHPTCSVQRRGGATRLPADAPSASIVEPGDLVHIDFGIVVDGMHTDQQQHGYVLRPGESTAPAGLVAGMEAANRLQDLLMIAFETGRTGNDLLATTLEAARRESIDGLVYTHPIGTHGHAAGPTIGLWDQQQSVEGSGDYPILANTAYSIELQARRPVPEWDNQVVHFMLEEEACFDGATCTFVAGRQEEPWLI